MAYHPPLLPRETFVADPPPLPGPGQTDPAVVTRASLLSTGRHGVELRAHTDTGRAMDIRVTVAGDGVIRVRLAADPPPPASPPRRPLVTPDPSGSGRVLVAEDTVRVNAGGLWAELTLDPWRLRFLDESGRVLLEQEPGQVDISGRRRTLPFGCSSMDGVVVAHHDSFWAGADERFVGFGEQFTRLDKRGQRLLMWNFDAFGAESGRSHKCVPFYQSSRGYGLLVDTATPAEFDLCQATHSSVQVVVPDSVLDYYVLAGPTPAQVLARYHRLTGLPALPPKWAFGTWISSGFAADTQQQVLDRAARIRELGIPCDVLHLDCYWQEPGTWSHLRWDRSAFPEPEQMLAELGRQGFRVSLWINPYLSHRSAAFTEAAEAGYLLRRPGGQVYVADVWHGSHPACGILDLTNPAAADWYARRLRELLKQGVAVFKTDFGEGVPADAVAHNGMTGARLHNIYPLLFNDLVSDLTREVTGHGLVWARSSYLGGQRHSAQWSGDPISSYPSMASTLRGGLSYALSGMPFWSHDVGGFHGPPTDDLYVRWAQFGALSPLVRLHGTTTRLPWDFPAATRDAAIAALRLRHRLLPYLYTTAVTAAATGTPMLRPLLFDTPDDPSAWSEELAYRLGPDLLVAPMTDRGGTRMVYLPAGEPGGEPGSEPGGEPLPDGSGSGVGPGAAWIDWWSGEVHPGGQWLRVSHRLDRVPLFVRYGALLPLAPVGARVGDEPFAELTLRSFGATSASTVVQDVDGATRITGTRDRETYLVTVSGPASVGRVEFAEVAGVDLPTRSVVTSIDTPDSS